MWYGTDGSDNEIFVYDGVTTQQLTDNSTNESVPQVSGEHVVWQSCDGSDFEIFVNVPVLPDFAANGSFVTDSDIDVLDIDFGVVDYWAVPAPIDFQIANLFAGDITADLELVDIVGIGHTGVLTTNVNLPMSVAAGAVLDFEAAIDTISPGVFGTTYELRFTDDLGTDQTLTLNLTGEVAQPAFVANASLDSHFDVNELTIDFGLVSQGEPVDDIPFGITNLPAGTSTLDLIGFTGSGQITALTTDLALFDDLGLGETANFFGINQHERAGGYRGHLRVNVLRRPRSWSNLDVAPDRFGWNF